MEAKTKSELAVELIDAMEASAFAPNAYVLASSLFAPYVIQRIEHYKKPLNAVVQPLSPRVADSNLHTRVSATVVKRFPL